MGSTEWAVISTGAAILIAGGVGYQSLHSDIAALRSEMRSDVAELRVDVGDLRGRMARLEGLFEGFTRRPGEER